MAVGLLRSTLSRFSLQSEAVSSSLQDAFPYFRSLRDLSLDPSRQSVAAEFRREGSVHLSPGVHEFEVQSFCLDAGRYGPGGNSRYLLAPMKGGRARVLCGLLQGACRHPDVGREDIQSLIWAVASGARYRSLPDHLRATADRLLPERELLLLGKSYADAIPVSLRGLLLDAVKSASPPHLAEAARRLQQIRDRICDATATYRDLEQAAVRFGSPPPPPAQEGRAAAAPALRGGEWSLVGGLLMRALPEGYAKTRLQVHVPGSSALQVVRDHAARIVQVQAPGGPVVDTTYADAHPGLPLRDGSLLQVWRFAALRVRSPEGPDGNGGLAEFEVSGWIARVPEELARLGGEVERDLSERILSARDTIEDQRVLRERAAPNSFPDGTGGRKAVAGLDPGEKDPGPADPIRGITDVGHYLDGIDAVLKDLMGGVKFDEKVKWLTEHFKRLRTAYANALMGLAGEVQRADEGLRFSCPSDLVAVSDNPYEQRLGFRCAF